MTSNMASANTSSRFPIATRAHGLALTAPNSEPVHHALQRPPRPVGRPDVFLRDAHVRHLPVLRIDLQDPAQPHRETPEQHHGRQAPAVSIERRAGGRAPFAGGDPLRVDAGRAGVFLAGGWATMSACFAGSSTLGSSPYVPATSLPSVPIHSRPPPRSG